MSETFVQDKEGNRAALLSAAVRCLRERGYARTTARDLVEASGTSLGAIGYHFGSKEGLLNEALAHETRSWLAQLAGMAAQLEGERDLGAALKLLATHLPAVLDEAGGLVPSFFEALAQVQRSDEVRARLVGQYEEYRAAGAAILRGLDLGDELDPRTVSAVIMAVVDGLMIQWLLDPTGVPSEHDLTRLIEGLRGG